MDLSKPSPLRFQNNHPGRLNASISDHMNSTFSASHHFGLAPPSNAYLAVMEAKFEKEQKKLQMLRMEARLRKLQTDEEKMKQRIGQARRQQEFVVNMKHEKQKQIQTKVEF
jgi:hypothetical protein